MSIELSQQKHLNRYYFKLGVVGFVFDIYRISIGYIVFDGAILKNILVCRAPSISVWVGR